MANLIETDAWEDGIYQWEEDDPVLGGPSGIDNVPPRQLANRTRYQRLRNITPWVPGFDYPAGAFVTRGGTTWKSLVPSVGVEPGTDAVRWMRWGYTAKEIAALLDDSTALHEKKADPHPVYAFRDGFDTVPTKYAGQVITVTEPHLRQMVWSSTRYVRAPWNQPGMVLYSYDNPATISGYLPIRGDVSYIQSNYPDLVARLGLSGVGIFTLVELRGEFIRCLDNGRGVDAGRGLRTAQAGDNQSHAHAVADPSHNHYVNDPAHAHGAWTDAQGAHSHGGYPIPLYGGDNDRGSAGSVFSIDNAVAIPVDGHHGHNVGVAASGTGIWLNGSGTGIGIHASGSEARPRNVALPAWVSY